jgi:hypothetical protein
MAWLPADFSHPTRVAVCDGYHLRPIKAADVDLDYPVAMPVPIFSEPWTR